MVERDVYSSYINGNNVLDIPVVEERIDYKNIRKNKVKKEYALFKIKYLKYVIGFLVIGLTLMSNQVRVYNKQMTLVSIENQVQAIQSENDALKMKAFEMEDIKTIEEKAKERDMVKIEKNQIKYKNIEKDYFTKYENIEKSESFLTKIMKFVK